MRTRKGIFHVLIGILGGLCMDYKTSSSNDYIQKGANEIIDFLIVEQNLIVPEQPYNNWVDVAKGMPEDEDYRVLNGDGVLTPDMSVRVLVCTDSGSIVDSKRLKMLVGEKEWVWFGTVEDEEIKYWCSMNYPDNEIYEDI